MTLTPEVRVLGRTRRQLVFWSAGSTLVVLILLGTALYGAIAQQLSSTSEAQLRQRADLIRTRQIVGGPRGGGPQPGIDIADDPRSPGLIFGGPGSGTIASIVPPDGASFGFGGMVVDEAALATARDGRDVVSVATVNVVGGGELPVRAYSAPLSINDQTFVIQVVADRTAELNTLAVTVVVLLVGSLGALIAAIAFGWLYAGRALVPIRESLRTSASSRRTPATSCAHR